MEYDLEEVYDEQIAPLMARILEICKASEMPMIASFAYRTGSFCSSALHFNDRPVERYEVAQKIITQGTHT